MATGSPRLDRLLQISEVRWAGAALALFAVAGAAHLLGTPPAVH